MSLCPKTQIQRIYWIISKADVRDMTKKVFFVRTANNYSFLLLALVTEKLPLKSKMPSSLSS